MYIWLCTDSSAWCILWAQTLVDTYLSKCLILFEVSILFGYVIILHERM